jgi:diguanylate cyclase (GGDEF)-like protein
MTTGMLALWSNRPLAVQGVSLLEALAPLLATQMRAAAELDLLRAGATVDAITGLPNRRALETRLADEQARFDRYRRPVSLVVIELDDLDRITDSLGPDTRDAVLRIIAAAVRATVREVDYPARYGASRLAVLLPETVRDPALDVAERVRQAAAAPFEYEGQHLQVAVSVGVSACPETVDAPADLIVSAEEALQASMKG